MIMNKTELLLNEGWKFHFGECEEAWYQGYDDRAFERVMLPHDWAVAYPFSKEYSLKAAVFAHLLISIFP